MELSEILKKASYNDIALIKLVEYYDSYILLYAKKINQSSWEDCYSYIKISFIQDVKSRKINRYLSKNTSELNQIIKRILYNKAFDYWRIEEKHFTESCTLNLEIPESSDGFIDNMINIIYLDELLDKLLTKQSMK